MVYKNDLAGDFKLLYGRALRLPTGVEALSAVALIGSPNNRPERIHMVQAAWSRGWADVFHSELGGFYSVITNRFITDADVTNEQKVNGITGRFTNVDGRLISTGVNGKLTLKLREIYTTVNFTRLLHTDDGNGAPIAAVPFTMVNANINIPVSYFSVNLSANYRGDFKAMASDPRPPVKDYLILGSTVGFALPDSPLKARLGVRNALNKRLVYPSSSIDYPEHFVGRKAEVWGDIAYSVQF